MSGLARTLAVTLTGLTGHIVEVEAHCAPGLPAFTLVGLPDAAVRESRERVRAALSTCGVTWGERRLTVNLSPADLPKTGTGFDVSLALAVLAARGELPRRALASLAGTVFIGELGLDASVRPVRGVLPAVHAAARAGVERVVVPAEAQAEKPAEEPAGKPDKEAATPAWLTREAARAQRRSSRRSQQRSDDDILLDGSTIVGRPASRAGAHWAGVLLSLVLLPMAWFFVHGAADVLTRTVEPHRFAFSPSAITELVAGLLIMSLALWTARRSSLGSIVVGALSAVLGLLFLLLPASMNGIVGPVLDRLAAQSALGADLAAYFWTDAFSGKFVVLGLFMIMVGIVSHSARRAGRREQEIINRGRRF